MIMAAIVAVLALAVTALAVTDDSDAAVDDTFTSGVYTCKILTETSSGGTVEISSDTPIPDPSVDRDGVADYVPYISLAAAVILTLIILIFYHPVLVIVDLALYVITAAGFMGWI